MAMPLVPSLADLARDSEIEGLVPLVRRFGEDLACTELGFPAPEAWAAQVLLQREPDAGPQALDSIPFAALCRAVFCPLLALAAHHQQRLFSLTPTSWTREERMLQLKDYLARPLGLSNPEKICWLTGDRFGSVRPWSEDRLLALLALCYFHPVEDLRKKMLELGGVGPLAASLGPALGEPLASRVVTLCLLHPAPRTHACWPELLKRCTPLERFMVVSRLAGKLDLSWGARQENLLQLVAEHYGVELDLLTSAQALEDLPRLVELLEEGGPAALKTVVLRPLAAFRPALAQSLEGTPTFPCWVDCKYDGIRLLLHKELDGLGNQRVAAYTRRRNDWSELVDGLAPMLSGLPASSLILDGELHGRQLDPEGVARPATVYEVHQCLRGELKLPLRYVAFDLLYLNGQDLTALPFQQRRQRLEHLLALKRGGGLPLELAQGSLVNDGETLNRLYQQFRRQGHEGVMVKDLQAPYPLALRSPAWLKRKPLESLELVLVGAYWGEGVRPGARLFDSYSLAARQGGSWREVGTVGGVDQRTTQQIVAEIWRLQLLTGQSKVHESNRGTAHGVELRPLLVVTVAFEDVLWDRVSGEISLRSPRILTLRSGEMPLEESTTWEQLERRAMRSRLG